MTKQLEKRQEGIDDVDLIVPYSSRTRVVSWVIQRFRLEDRKFFWCAVAFIATSVFVSSGLLLQATVRAPIYMLAEAPIVGGPIKALVRGPIGEGFSRYVNNLASTSPVDHAIRGSFDSLDRLSMFPESNTVFTIAGLFAILIWLLLFARMFRSPSSLSVSDEGLSLTWNMAFSKIKGPVVPWSDVIGITLKRQGGDNSQDGRLDVIYATGLWQYKLFQSATEVGVNKFTLDLRNFETLEQRHKLGNAFEKYAPGNTVQPEVVEILSATQSQTYTELWLQALTAPSKRESLEPLPPGKVLRNGQYQIHSQLGVGGQGTAYIAQCMDPSERETVPPADSDDFVIKTGNGQNEDEISHVLNIVVKEFVLPLYVDSNSRKEALRRFLDEADLLKRLDHQRVVKLSDCFVEDHRGYLVLERIHGNSLKQIVIDSGAMTEGRVLELLDQMIDVLDYLHGQEPPVVHRDFAPDNLILGKDGILKLVDFNVAQQTENAMTGTIVGKQSYVPPEQLRGMATPASDIYALGATLHFLLTGSDPEPLSVLHPRELASHVSKETDELIARSTQLDENDRLKSVSEIRDYISQVTTWHQQSK